MTCSIASRPEACSGPTACSGCAYDRPAPEAAVLLGVVDCPSWASGQMRGTIRHDWDERNFVRSVSARSGSSRGRAAGAGPWRPGPDRPRTALAVPGLLSRRGALAVLGTTMLGMLAGIDAEPTRAKRKPRQHHKRETRHRGMSTSR